MELLEKLIPDLVNIVTGYLGTGIFPDDFILPFDEWEYLKEEKPIVKIGSEYTLCLYDDGIRSPINMESIIMAGRIITQCAICDFTIFGNKYVLIGDLIDFADNGQFCCSDCVDYEEYELIDSKENLYMPVSCFKYNLKGKKTICRIRDGLLQSTYLYIDLGDKVLFVEFLDSLIGYTKTKTNELEYSQLISHINTIISMLKK